jgi:hypothetical protein
VVMMVMIFQLEDNSISIKKVMFGQLDRAHVACSYWQNVLTMPTSVFQTSVKMKLVCQQVAKSLLGEHVDVS